MTLGKMIKKILFSYLAIDFMMLFINLPFTGLVSNGIGGKLLPCIILGTVTLIISFALMIGYMGPVGEEAKSNLSDAPLDWWLAMKAAIIVFAIPFTFSVFTAMTGAGIILDTSFYGNMRFPHNIFYGPLFGYVLTFYPRSWLTPLFPAPIMVCVIQISYWIILKGFKLPKIFYRQK